MVIMLVKVQRIRIFIAHQDRTEQKATYHYITLPYDITEWNHRDCKNQCPTTKKRLFIYPNFPSLVLVWLSRLSVSWTQRRQKHGYLRAHIVTVLNTST